MNGRSTCCIKVVAVISLALLSGCALVQNGDNDAGTAKLVVFEDPDSSFTTRDVHDVDGDIV